MEKKKITIAHLYPKMLNLYGDIGNIITLEKRCEWLSIDLQYDEINLGEKITSHDFYFIGGGQDKQQEAVALELLEQKNFLIDEAEQNSVFLGICGGYQLLGQFYKTQDGKKLYGAGLLDTYTEAGSKRFIGNVTAETSFLTPSTLVGFENHAGHTYLQGETKPLAIISEGFGNNGKDKTEGARAKNVFGTYLHGSILPKNPHFADYLIKLALEKHYGETIELPSLNDEIEWQTHKSLIGKK